MQRGTDPPSETLSNFIRDRQEALIAEWSSLIATMSPARELSRPVLIDHVPQILASIADLVESTQTRPTMLARAPKQHAMDRLARGFDLSAVIAEYSLLRQCILARWESEAGANIAVSELRRLDAALDHSIMESAVSFAHARERMLKAVDRISEAGFGAVKLDAFLNAILQATLETTEAVDTAAIFLREGDVVRMRAAIGMDQELEQGFTARMGEGLAGKVAASREPMMLRHAATDALVQSPTLHEHGVRALYALPLIHGEMVVGIAYIGSRTAFEFSEEDQLLFRTMASRATSVILHAQLVVDLEKAVADRDGLVSQLATERARLEHILNQMPVGVIIAEGPEGKIAFENERSREILGTRLSGNIAGSSIGQPLHADGRPYEAGETPSGRALRGEHVVDEFNVRRADDRMVMIRANAAPVRDDDRRIQGAVVAFEDVSDQKRREQSLGFLSEASHQLSGSMDYERTLARIVQLAVPAMADWMSLELMEDGQIRSVIVSHSDPAKVARATELRQRYPVDRDASRGIANVLRTGQAELYETLTDEVLSESARDPVHLELLREVGIRSAMVVPLKVRGDTIGALTLIFSESGRNYSPADLDVAQGLAERAAITLENARLFREAERAIRLRDDLLAIVSHDLRNPLGAISLSAALLFKKFGADRRARRPVDTIQRAAGRMARLISDLLDMASIQAGGLSITPSPQEIASIVSEAVQGAEPLAVEKSITIKSAIMLARECCSVDRDRMHQLFSNLLGNAIKFCPEGGTIEVRARSLSGEVECSVSDTGPGIAESELPHIFDRYWSAKRHGKQGTGLGLYISKAIVEAHGGRIRAESEVGMGTTVAFTLPLCLQPNAT